MRWKQLGKQNLLKGEKVIIEKDLSVCCKAAKPGKEKWEAKSLFVEYT